MKSTLSQQLSKILSRPIDDTTRRRTAVHVRDWIACCAVGSQTEAGSLFADYAKTLPKGNCTTFSSGMHDSHSAAFLNGGLGSLHEMDDIHRTSIVHPGDVIIPASLALAQSENRSGAEFLDAIIRGYEAAIRVGKAAGHQHYRHWYNTATCGVFGSAVAASSLYSLNQEMTVDALGHAGMQATGLWQCRSEPGFSKQLATSRASKGGIEAADLARSGFIAPQQIFEGKLGFFAAMAPDEDPEQVTIEPGAPWQIFETSFKPWPACRHAHPAIELALRVSEKTTASAIHNVTIKTYQSAIDFCDQEAPDTPHKGRFSLQHCFAWTLLSGPPGLESFTLENLFNDEVTSLRRLIKVEPSEALTMQFPERYQATAYIQLKDGTSFEEQVLTAKGDPENPMTDTELENKFKTLLSIAGHPLDVIDGIINAIDELHSQSDISDFSAALSRLIKIS